MKQHIRAGAGVTLVLLAGIAIATTRPAAAIAGQPTVDRAHLAEVTFPYPHLSILRITGDGLPDDAKLVFDDGSVAVATQVIYQVPADGQPARAEDPVCDEADQICWGTTTVDPSLQARVELTYAGVPCEIAGSPAERTTIECSEPE